MIMSLQYVGLNEINGPLVVLDHVKGASYDEMVEIQINDDVITYLMKDRLPKEQGNLSFLHLLGMNCVNLKIVI